MAFKAYLTLKGKSQGEIHGSVKEKGRENSILVHAYSQAISTPRDTASGLATGKRQHTPLVIVKEVDSSSPPLWTALINNEVLVGWELKFWATAVAPLSYSEGQIYTVKLTNANIASIREYMVDNEDAAGATLPLRQEISFTYQRIEWIWTAGGLVAQDDWESPVA